MCQGIPTSNIFHTLPIHSRNVAPWFHVTFHDTVTVDSSLPVTISFLLTNVYRQRFGSTVHDSSRVSDSNAYCTVTNYYTVCIFVTLLSHVLFIVYKQETYHTMVVSMTWVPALMSCIHTSICLVFGFPVTDFLEHNHLIRMFLFSRIQQSDCRHRVAIY